MCQHGTCGWTAEYIIVHPETGDDRLHRAAFGTCQRTPEASSWPDGHTDHLHHREGTTKSPVPAAEVTEGQRVYCSVHARPITVIRVRHNVRYNTRRVTFVHGTDAHGVLVELICDPEFEFVLPIED